MTEVQALKAYIFMRKLQWALQNYPQVVSKEVLNWPVYKQMGCLLDEIEAGLYKEYTK